MLIKIILMKKIVFLILFCFCLNFSLSFAEEAQKEMEGFIYIDFYDFITTYNVRNKNIVSGAYNNKKIDLRSSSALTYLQPAEKYIAFLEYRGSDRDIDVYQKPFLLDWFKISNSKSEYTNDDTAESILADENFKLFFTSTMYSTRGRAYFLTTQRAISDNMKKKVKNGELIKLYLLNLGQYSSDMPVFLVIGYEKTAKISQAIQDKMYFQQYFPVLKNDIFNRRYDKAKGSIELLLKKYPKNMELRLNLCLIYNQTNYFNKSIDCYKKILQENDRNYDAYYGLASAIYNSSKKSTNNTDKMKEVIKYSTRSIEIINSMTNYPRSSLAMIYYNSLYLRAMAKISLGDKTAIDDLIKINEKQPTLVSSVSILLYKKMLDL